MAEATNHGAIITSGVLLGIGLGGFADGILFHQILQWHHMLSSVRPPIDLPSMKYNMLHDGLFHAVTWVVTIAGLARLWAAGKRRDVRWSTAALVGSLLLGWGLFNFVEGLVSHQILRIHHVRPGPGRLVWDLAFLASGLAMAGAGLAVIRASLRAPFRGTST
jgi:uncharacterized membrane protein